MKQFDNCGVGQQRLQIWAIRPLAAQRRGNDLHQMRCAVPGRKLHQAESVALRVQPHRLGIDRNHRSKAQPSRQVVLMQLDCAHVVALRWNGDPAGKTALRINVWGSGAQEKTRTSMTLRSLAPEASASTNFATWAGVLRPMRSLMGRLAAATGRVNHDLRAA